jgi:hypothetical protein
VVVVVVDSVVVVAGAAGVAGASVVVVVVSVVVVAAGSWLQAARTRAAAEAATAKVSLNDMEQIPPTDHMPPGQMKNSGRSAAFPLRRTKPQYVESLRF